VLGLALAATESIIRAFQDVAGTTADGVVGPVTWGKLTGFRPTSWPRSSIRGAASRYGGL